MIDYAGLKAIFGTTLPEAHIFFATRAANKFVPNYSRLRRELGYTTARTNRFIWRKFEAEYAVQNGGAIAAPVFSTDLTSPIEVLVGDPLNLIVAAEEGDDQTEVTTFRWTKNGSTISGVTGAAYTVASATTADNGTYVAFAIGTGGTTPSKSAVVTVTPREE